MVRFAHLPAGSDCDTSACIETFKSTDVTTQEGIPPCAIAIDLIPVFLLLAISLEESCNVESFEDQDDALTLPEDSAYISYCLVGKILLYVFPQSVKAHFKKLASDHGIKTSGMALVGITPEEYQSPEW
ncbi:formiminotransferase N-terminal subdomain-containing protein [Apteryx mantelli]|uniref:Formiminotransferase N-terminal subdomain-containing protein n=1 Tax=Apteryx mantelli TaxID=2696672 RepID=A0ABM4EPU2_9AVES